MTEFNKSQWAKAEYAEWFRDGSDVYIERKRLIEILKSFYKHFVGDNKNSAIFDLGCGDGIITHELIKIDNSIKSTLLDGSEYMNGKAKHRLKDFKNLDFVQASFQDIINKKIVLKKYDFVVSSLAIHHLSTEEKSALFNSIHACLNPGGYFLNIDVVLSPSDTIEQWYILLWKQWIEERKLSIGIEGNYDDVIDKYKNNLDNKPDTLDMQINALKTIGFKDVDCFYKYGIFAMYGGKKVVI